MVRLPRLHRVLAAPFVVTAALSAACAAPQPPLSPTGPTATAPTAEPTTEPTTEPTPPRVIANPPPLDPAPPGTGSWAKDPAEQWVFTYASGDRVFRDEAGACELRVQEHCRAGMTCNPPRPRAVACPDGLPEAAGGR